MFARKLGAAVVNEKLANLNEHVLFEKEKSVLRDLERIINFEEKENPEEGEKLKARLKNFYADRAKRKSQILPASNRHPSINVLNKTDVDFRPDQIPLPGDENNNNNSAQAPGILKSLKEIIDSYGNPPSPPSGHPPYLLDDFDSTPNMVDFQQNTYGNQFPTNKVADFDPNKFITIPPTEMIQQHHFEFKPITFGSINPIPAPNIHDSIAQPPKITSLPSQNPPNPSNEDPGQNAETQKVFAAEPKLKNLMSEVTSLKPTSVVSHIYGLKYSKNQNGSSSENFNAKGTSVNNVRQSIDEAYDQFMNEIDA